MITVLNVGSDDWKAVWRCVCVAWREYLDRYRTCCNVYVCSNSLLTWARNHGYVGSASTTTIAMRYDALDVATTSHFLWGETKRAFFYAAIRGHIDMMNLLHTSYHYIPPIFFLTAYNGHLDAVKWLTHHCGMSSSSMYGAAKGGHKHILQWAFVYFRHKIWCEDVILDNAVKGGHLELVKWLRDIHNCPWTEMTFYYAVESGSLDMVKYIDTHQCELFYFHDVFGVAAERGHLHILQYLHSKHVWWDYELIYKRAEIGGHQHVIQWLDEF